MTNSLKEQITAAREKIVFAKDWLKYARGDKELHDAYVNLDECQNDLDTLLYIQRAQRP